MTLDEIITALRCERELRGWSFRDVSNACAPTVLSTTAIWNYERGHCLPSVRNLSNWANALGYVLITELAVKPVSDPPSRES